LYFYIDDIQAGLDNALIAGAKLASPVEDRNWATKPATSPARTDIFWLLRRELIIEKIFKIVALQYNYQYLYFVNEETKQRKIIFYKDYFKEFFIKQRENIKEKIIWTLELIEELPRIPQSYLKHIEGTNGLFEIRIQFGSDIFRIFCFFDQGKLIVLANGFQKKDQKTPKKEIEKALKIKDEYEKEIVKLREVKSHEQRK
jgi:phage-related protein